MNLYLLPPPTPLHRALHRRLERKVCTNASLIVTNQWHEAQLKERYPSAPVTIIRNGFDADKMSVTDASPANDRMQITHAGMLTQKRSAIPFLEGLALFLRTNPAARVRLRVTFAGPRESANDEHVATLGLGDVVEFVDTMPHVESLRLQKRSHILLLIKHLNPDYEGLIPGKLFEYIGAQRPILALVPPGEVADIVLEHRRGEVAPLDDARKVCDAIAAMFARFESSELDAPYNLTETEMFTREAQTKKLADYLDHVIEGQKRV